MLDLRLYSPTGNYADRNNVSEYMQLVRPDDPSALDIEVIAGKVVKFLLTSRGSETTQIVLRSRVASAHTSQVSRVA